MAFSLGTLTAYVEQNANELLTKSVFGGKTISMLTKKVGIKSSETLNIMDTDAIIQAGGTCGFNSSGTTSITQRVLTVGKMKVQESLCPPDLEAYFTQKALEAGSDYDMIAYAKEYSALKVAKINRAMELLVWRATTSGGDQFNGLRYIIDNATGVIEANSTAYYGTPATEFNDTNALQVAQAVFKAIPADVIDAEDLVAFCGWDFFKNLINKITNSNFFAYVTDAVAKSGEITIPGTTLKFVAVHGLDNQNAIYCGQRSNMFYGTDLLSEEDKYSLKYDEVNELVKFSCRWKSGVQIAFPNQIVAFRIPPL
jgi:hypothetical protein